MAVEVINDGLAKDGAVFMRRTGSIASPEDVYMIYRPKPRVIRMPSENVRACSPPEKQSAFGRRLRLGDQEG